MRTIQETAGIILANLRKKKKWSQTFLANKLKVTRQYVWKYENGEINLTLAYIYDILSVLEANESDFLNCSSLKPSN